MSGIGFHGMGGMGALFHIFPVLFFLVFAIVIGCFIAVLARSASEQHRNNQSPRLTVDAEVVAKRADVRRRAYADAGDVGMAHTRTSTVYYATFQLESGDRMELHVSGSEYGLLLEGDKGKLTFQGTRYLSFTRGSSI